MIVLCCGGEGDEERREKGGRKEGERREKERPTSQEEGVKVPTKSERKMASKERRDGDIEGK